jgi:hypothetical protein
MKQMTGTRLTLTTAPLSQKPRKNRWLKVETDQDGDDPVSSLYSAFHETERSYRMRNSDGDLPVHRRQAWLKELG